MSTSTRNQPGLVVASNFVQAARDTGYISLATALGELLDNSIQASASEIDIEVSRREASALPMITVTDDGRGMDRGELGNCLKFGGTSRFNDRSSLGRYGMGLPGASLSQAKTVIVETWRPGHQPSRVRLCLAEAVAGNLAGLSPRRVALDVPIHPPSGCRITWQECDRIEYQRLGWLERSLASDLGRMFRRFIECGLLIRVNGRRIPCRDPLFLESRVDGLSATLPFEPLRYDISGADGQPSPVTVRFSELPVHGWHHLDTLSKRRMGIVGQAGVSILRAGREIAYGWHFMGGKRKENYDDWWRCEVEFDPSLDEQFGITHSKQGIRPTPELREALEADIESMARLLNGRVRQAFEAVKFSTAAQRSCRIAEAADADLPVIRRKSTRRGSESPRLSYRLESAAMPDDRLFGLAVTNSVLVVTINSDHPAFTAIYQPLIAMATKEADDLRVAIELLLMACARAQALLEARPSQSWTELPALWSDALGKMLRRA